MLKLDNFSLSYGRDEKSALKNITMNIKTGECVLFTGESGSGKSSIINSINGLALEYDNANITGSVKVGEKELRNMEIYEISILVTSVFQNPKTHFFNINTTLELLFYLENIGLSREEMNYRMEVMLNLFPIGHLLGRNIFEMSGGEKQILCVAACYISGCKIIVLDEPSSNLDEIYINILSQMLNKLKKLGVTLILAEHRIYYLKEIVDRIFVIQRGRILHEYTAKDFFQLNVDELQEMGLRSSSKTHLSVGDNTSQDGIWIKSLSYSFSRGGKLEMMDVFFKTGNIYGIVGKNGCGKSTFSRCLIGVEKSCKDKIFWNGRLLSKRERLQNSGFVMQDVNHQLFSDSVEKELRIGIEDLQETKINAVLEELGLSKLRNRHPMSLSGGEKQRVAIASLWCKNPRLVFFDEPTSGMDYKNMIRISNLIKKMKIKNRIIFIVSHDYEFLNRTVDEVENMAKYRL